MADAPVLPPAPPVMHASMPGRSHSSAPKFDGAPSSLKRFLTEVCEMATEKGLSTPQAIRATVSYAPSNDHELWNVLKSASGDDWGIFEQELCLLYPGSEGDRKYNCGHLDALVCQSALVLMTDHLQFREYYRSFMTIAVFLKSKMRFSDQEISSRFLEGLHHLFRGNLADYLRIKEPTHHIDDPWDIAALYESVLFVLSNRNGGASMASVASIRTPVPANVKTEVFDASSIGRYLELDSFLNRIKMILTPAAPPQPQYHPYMPPPQNYAQPPQNYAQPPQNFAQPPQRYAQPPQQRTASEVRFQNSTAAYNTNVAPPQQHQPPRPPPPPPPPQQQFPPQQQYGQQQPPNTCNFCSELRHFQYDCAIARDYLNRGLCKWNEYMQLVLPSGERINSRIIPGTNIKERLDAWHRMHSAGPTIPVASTNFLDVSSTQDCTDPWSIFSHEVTSAHISDVPDEDSVPTQRETEHIELLQHVAASANRRINETRAKIAASQFGPTTRARAYDTPAATTSAVRDPPPHMPPYAPIKPAGTEVSPAVAVTVPVPVIAVPSAPPVQETSRPSRNPFVSSTAPQFTYHTPIESPATVKEVVEQSLDSTVTLTNRQLLAVAPDVRKALKDQIGTRRTAAVNEVGADGFCIETFLQSLVPKTKDIIVANHIEKLRAINVELAGAGTVEAVMDEGSQIVALRADIWAKTGIPLHSDHLMEMESANQMFNDTKGLLPNFPMVIGNHTFYIQIQVVKNASYEMLLGLPFHIYCQASTQYFLDGGSQITLIDQNTSAVIMVPTFAHTKKSRKGKERAEASAGFQ